MELVNFGFLLYFLPIMLVGYYLFAFQKVRNVWLVLCGLAFYFLNGLASVALVVVISMLNYLLGFAISRSLAASVESPHKTAKTARERAKSVAKALIRLSIFINVLPLFLFILLPQILHDLPFGLRVDLPFSIIVPFGIAFLALQGISYTADIYLGKVKWSANIVNVLVYFTFFPAAFAGPIIKYHEIADQLDNRQVTFDKIADGISRLVVGMAKLCIIAQPLLSISSIITERSNLSGLYTGAPASLMLLGLLSSVIGMYHFFSGFSDVAIGIGKMLGFEIPENFDHPHLATTMSAFWQRCYRSLTGWFDEYVYDVLAKKRSNNDQMVLHTLLMWLLLGIWTGPNLPHIIFGFWNFVFILFERVVEMQEKKKKKLFRRIYIAIVVLVSVTALNTTDMYEFTLYISNLFGMKGYGFRSDFAMRLLTENWWILLVGFLTSFPIATALKPSITARNWFYRALYTLIYPAVMVLLVLLIVIRLSGISYDPTQLFNTYLWS